MRNTELVVRIAETFEDLLIERGIQIMCKNPSEESDRVNETIAINSPHCLYGSEFWNITDQIEGIIDEHDKRNNVILHNIFQDTLDTRFNYNYEEFENYLRNEIGVTSDEIESLKRVELYVQDINGNDL